MPTVASVTRTTLVTTFVLALASACGGQSFTGNDGEGGEAGTGQGGTISTAGTTSTAGKPHGGTSIGGTGSGGTTSVGGSGIGGTGIGGTPSEECSAPPDGGLCEAYIPSWYNDPSTGICRPFVYGGCGGNKNRYASLEACQRACPGGSPNYDACQQPTDCVVTGVGCCGICDGPNITARDLIAYNEVYAGLLQCGVALDIAAGGAGSGAAAPIACAPCPLPLPGEGTLKYFVPDCLAGQCVVADLRTSPVTACKTSAECKVRRGTGCCESCGSDEPIAVRNDGSFEKLVCGDGPVGCLACVPQPIEAIAVCGATGRCEVDYLPVAGTQ